MDAMTFWVLVLVIYEVNFIEVMSSGGGARLTQLVQTRAQCYRAPRHLCQRVHKLVRRAIPKWDSSGEV